MWLWDRAEATITDAAGSRTYSTYTCAHCNRITHVGYKMHPADIGGLCKLCMGLTCKRCTGKGCRPFEKQLEAWEARCEALRSYGLS